MYSNPKLDLINVEKVNTSLCLKTKVTCVCGNGVLLKMSYTVYIWNLGYTE